VNIVLVGKVAADEDLFDFELSCGFYGGEDSWKTGILG
jgi:hypothetical protein